MALVAAGEYHIWEFFLSFQDRCPLPFLLPVVDHFSGLVQQGDPLRFGDPLFRLQLVVEFLPGIIPWPEVVGGQRASAFADDLINGDRHVSVQPKNF